MNYMTEIEEDMWELFFESVSSKLAYGGGREGQKLVKSCLRSLWMAPN